MCTRDEQKKYYVYMSGRTTRVNKRGVGANNRATGTVIRRAPNPNRTAPYVPPRVVRPVPTPGQVPPPTATVPTGAVQPVRDVQVPDPDAGEMVELDLNVVTPPTDDEQAAAFPATGKNGPRVRNFVFTLPNYTDEEYNWFLTRHGNPTWMIVAKEKCPSTGTPHLQGIKQTQC